MTRVLVGIAWAVTMVFAAFAANAQTGGAPISIFAPGQKWSIKSAAPTTATIIIGRVEAWRDKVCISVSIVDIPVPPGMPGAGGVTQIAHAPFDATAIVESIDQLLASDIAPAPNFEAGYEQWRSAKGGIFTITVGAAIEVILRASSRR